METTQTPKKGFFNSPLLKTRIKSAQAKLFPEGAIGYFIGPTFAMLANSVISGQFSKYMTDIININAWTPLFWTLLPLISAVFVVVGNILVGRLMDNMKTSAGKARPLLLISLPLAVLSLLLLFIISPYSNGAIEAERKIATLVFIAIGYNLWFGIAYPFYFTSHSALVSLSTRNSKDRSLLATISNATHLAAMGLCSMVLPFFSELLFVPVYVGGVKVGIDPVASYEHWKIFVIALLVINVLGVLVEYLFTRERVTEERMAMGAMQESKKATSFAQQAKVCFKDKYWVLMIIFFLLYQLGGMMKNTSQVYYAIAWLNEAGDITSQSYHGLISTVGAVPTAIGMLIAWPLSNKIGKGRAIVAGSIISVIGGAIGFIAPDNVACVLASFIIKAFGSTPAMYLSIALLADIMDHQEAKFGIRTDGLSMMIYGAIMAGMTGVATAILMAITNACGYNAQIAATAQSDSMRTAMLWTFVGAETLCYAGIALLTIFIGVEKFSKFDHKAIVADQKAAAEAEGKEYVDPKTRMEREEKQALEDSRKAVLAELKATCEKKGLDYEAEEKKYLEKIAEEDRVAAEKKAAAQAKKQEAEAKKQAEFDALPEEQKQAILAKKAVADEKKAKAEAEALVEYNKMRIACGRTPIEL